MINILKGDNGRGALIQVSSFARQMFSAIKRTIHQRSDN
jgi:hypothetical protein